MTRSRILAPLAGAALLSLVVLFVSIDPVPEDKPDWMLEEEARLENWLPHADPSSAEAFKLKQKLGRLEAYRKGLPQAGFPDEFARALHEIKIPSDRTTAQYRPGYQLRELKKAPRQVASFDKALTWVNRGPGNVAGRARDIIVHPSDPSGQSWYIASVGGGVWRTLDGGGNWVELTDEMPNLGISTLAMHRTASPDIIYAGTGESYYNIDTMNGNGILKSWDRGETWVQLTSTTSDPFFNNVSRIIASPTDTSLVLASTTAGIYKASLYPESRIYRSTDGGFNWTVVHAEFGSGTGDINRIQQLIADPDDFNIQYACVNGDGIMKSTDAGLTWSDINIGITDSPGRFEMAISPVNSDYLFASAEGSPASNLWVSWDGGANWNQTVENGGSEPNWLGAQGWYDNTITCHPTDARIVYVGGPLLFKITLDAIGSDNRSTTSTGANGPVHVDNHGLQIVDTGGSWFILNTNDGGVGVSSFEDTGWSAPIAGMTTTQFYGVTKKPGASAYFGGMQDNGTWWSPDDPGQHDNWFWGIGGDGYETQWHFDDPNRMIGGFQYNGFNRSLDGGVTWTPAIIGLDDRGAGFAPFLTKIASSYLRPDVLFAVGTQGVWRSTDFGGSWSLSNTPQLEWGSFGSFHDVRVSDANPDVVWAGGRMDSSGKLLWSLDGGQNFSPSTNYTDVTMGRISGLATDPHDGLTAYALFSFGQRPKILKTTTLGSSWTDISGFGTGSVSTNGFPDVAVYDLLVWPNDPNRIWVGTEIGLVESLDGGATWALANNGLPAVGIWFMTAVEDEIILATHGRGVWSVTIPELEDGRTFKPLITSLYQSLGGNMQIETNLRSAYDSTQVWVDGSLFATIPANEKRQIESVEVPVMASATRTVLVRGIKDGTAHNSVLGVLDVVALSAPVFSYQSAIDDGTDLSLTDMVVTTPSGFTNPALHTAHFYQNASSPMALLTVPIKMGSATRLEFDEIAVVEPGEPGSVFGDFDFWDYVIVEGTIDGLNWVPVIEGYDARADAGWLALYNFGNSADSSMYEHRVINLNDTFSTGETILLRFRMFADAAANAWGWAVDNIEIIQDAVVGTGDLPTVVSLDQNYPNPFNPMTTISFSMPERGQVRLEVFDTRGMHVRTLLNETRNPGNHQVIWDGRDHADRNVGSGIYLYRLTTPERSLQRKMILVR